jgi:phytoene synthase
VYDERFIAMMREQAERAETFYREADAAITDEDRAALVPARIMGEIYHAVLAKMRADGFKVFDKRYRISGARKLAILSKRLLSRGPAPC